MDPLTLALIFGGVGAAGSITQGVMGFFGSRKQARALQQQSSDVQAQAESANIAEMRSARRLIGEQRARAGASGVDLSGSPSILTAETLAEAAMSARDRTIGAGRQSDVLRMQARQVKKAGDIGLITSGIGAAGSLAGAGLMYGLNKVPTGGLGDQFGIGTVPDLPQSLSAPTFSAESAGLKLPPNPFGQGNTFGFAGSINP